MTKTVKTGYVMPVIIMSNTVHCLQQNYKPYAAFTKLAETGSTRQQVFFSITEPRHQDCQLQGSLCSDIKINHQSGTKVCLF